MFAYLWLLIQYKSNILITGDSGTGKELVAHAIHTLGPTSTKRFIAVNCSAISETLLESELFGHKKGSFTSATEDKKGFFEVAHGGTLFLDEIGYMPLSCQVKLLRAIEEKQVIPVGSTEAINIDLLFFGSFKTIPGASMTRPGIACYYSGISFATRGSPHHTAVCPSNLSLHYYSRVPVCCRSHPCTR